MGLHDVSAICAAASLLSADNPEAAAPAASAAAATATAAATSSAALVSGAYAWDATAACWRPWVSAVAAGVDPGLASTGVAVIVRWSNGAITSAGAWLVETSREKGMGVRAGMDDARRMRELWDFMLGVFGWARPNVVGIEAYETFQPKAITDLKHAASRLVNLGVPPSRARFVEMIQDEKLAGAWIAALGRVGETLRDAEGWTPVGMGQAAKTIGVQWIASCAAYTYSAPVYVYEPKMMKKAVTGRQVASKEDVGAAVEQIVEGAREHAENAAPPSKRNHVHDGYGHALAALYEYEQWRAAYGT